MEIDKITETIIGCAFTVSNTLGAGFLEKVYENALAIEIQKAGLVVQQQYGIQVFYAGSVVGEYVADLLVENQVIVELKSAVGLDNIHMAQCMNYLKATGMKICLLINFGKPKIQIKRIIANQS
jgi:GxxExxY protein